nr:hypothetical protein [uncultured Tyzzerella sp.]
MRYIDIKFYEDSIEKFGNTIYIYWTFILDNEDADIDSYKFDKNLPLRTFLNIVAEHYLEERFDFIEAIDNVLNGKLKLEDYCDEEIYVKITKETTNIESMIEHKCHAPLFTTIDPNINYGVRYLEPEEMYNEISTEELRELCVYCINEIEKYKKEYASKGITLHY